ncbi:phage major capsid protein [Tsuneonella sp. HG094]
MNLAVLRAQARDVATRQANRLQAAIDENRDLTDDEETADAADKAELSRLTAQIQRGEQLVAAQQAIGVDTASTAPSTVPAQPKTGEGSNGFRDIAEFAHAVRHANPAAGSGFRVDDRLGAPTNVNMEQGDVAGSYLVPADFRQEIVDLVYSDRDPVLDLIDPSPTSSNRVQGLGDETTPWGSSGVLAKWRVEAEQMTPTKLGLTPRETKLNECYAFVLATEELLEDAPRIADLLTRKAGAAIRWTVAEAFMWGDGVEKPLGWMESGALVTVAKETSQTADSIVAANAAKMFARMIDPANAVWLANADIMPTVMGLKSDAGDPVWFPNYQDAPGGTLLGRPIRFTEHAKTVGDKGDLQFVNPNGYEAFRKQSGVQFAESIHLYFDYNIRAFRWIFRVGGQPVLSAPVSPAKGSSTKSHFVALADRA